MRKLNQVVLTLLETLLSMYIGLILVELPLLWKVVILLVVESGGIYRLSGGEGFYYYYCRLGFGGTF